MSTIRPSVVAFQLAPARKPAESSGKAAETSWASFWADPEWAAVRAGGEQVTASATSVFLDPTEFSELR